MPTSAPTKTRFPIPRIPPYPTPNKEKENIDTDCIELVV